MRVFHSLHSLLIHINFHQASSIKNSESLYDPFEGKNFSSQKIPREKRNCVVRNSAKEFRGKT